MNRPHIERRPLFPEPPDAPPFPAPASPCLQDCIARYAAAIPGLAELGKRLATTHDADALIDLYFLGIDNVLVLRGDAAKNETFFEPEPEGHRYAIDLLKQTVNLNNGIYLEESIRNGFRTNFCIGVAGYPQKHFESPNAATDMLYLKAKVDAGAEYIVTQMFFDNRKYFDFVKNCRDNGIDVPIIPGLKPVSSVKQLSLLPRTFHVDIPAELSTEILRCKTDTDVEIVGTEWLKQQSLDLKKAGVPVLHYYTLGKPKIIENVVKAIL